MRFICLRHVKQMKVGFLVSSISRQAGGLFQSVRGLAKSVASEDVDVAAFGIRDRDSAVDALEWRPVAVRTSHSQVRAWGYSGQLLPALLGADLDILSSHGLWKYSSFASLRWHQRTRRPYIVHPHGMLEPWALQNAGWKKQLAARLYENQHLRKAACIRALCDAEAQSIRAYGLRNPVCVVPNGVDLPELAKTTDHGPPTTDLRQLASEKKILLYLGRLHPKKNVANLIRAWKQTLSCQPSTLDSWILAIVGWGEGGYEAQLRQLTSDFGLTTSVIFLGPQFGAAKSRCYSACDAFILPSLSEGLPMTVLEAWAHAKPVVMTSECNLLEGVAAEAALQIGTTPEQIAAGIRHLSEMSNADRKTMGDHGRDLVATKFSWPCIAEQMCAVFQWMLSGGATPATVRV